MKRSLSTFAATLRRVYARPGYIALSLAVALMVCALSVYTINYDFVHFALASGLFSMGEQWRLLGEIAQAYYTAIGLESQIGIILVAALSAINISFFVYYMRHRISKQRAAGIGMIGIITGFFGIGCGACGSVLLTTLFGLGATTQVLGVLPLQGFEITLLSMAILLWGSIFLAHKIQDPDVCPITLPLQHKK